ncbi:hypothetical protein NMG60_11032532 [Bertholletia excelsa]
MLLHPRNATEFYSRNLKLNLNGSRDSKYYYCCGDRQFSLISYYRNNCPLCRRFRKYETNTSDSDPQGRLFAEPRARFIITDDFQVFLSSANNVLSLLSNFGVTDGDKVKEKTINIGKEEVLKLLVFSLTSRTPFSDTIMGPVVNETGITNICGPLPQSQRLGDISTDAKINLKLFVNKSNNKALYAEVGEDFLDVLCSFLAFPIGYVFKEFSSLTFNGCLGNLYRSVQQFDTKLFTSEEMRTFLVSPKLPPGLAYGNQLIGIEEAVVRFPSPEYCHTISSSNCIEGKIGGGFIRGPSLFLVKDDLSFAPSDAFSSLAILNWLGVPLSNVKEVEVTMGGEEALHLLVASVASKSALTAAFLSKEPKREPTKEP